MDDGANRSAASPSLVDRVAVVLVEPQNPLNIGTVLRGARNFGIEDIRLVNPASADPERISITARSGETLLAKAKTFTSLDAALADCSLVFAATARPRKAAETVMHPGAMAQDAYNSKGRIALLLGREDSGLPNEALDRANAMVTIPTAGDYASLNLGQAATLLMWEFWRVDTSTSRSVATEFSPASKQAMERLFGQIEESLQRVEFFKTPTTEHVMRSFRNVLGRARLDEREFAIFIGAFKEVVGYLDRRDPGEG